MSSSSSAESSRIIQNPDDHPEIPLIPGLNHDRHQEFANSRGSSDEVSENFNKMAKAVNSKSKEYKKEDTSDKIVDTSSDDAMASQLETENNAVTNKMNNALDVFFQFEDMADSESRECGEFQTERAIIREMCNVVIKKLDFNKEWDLES